MTSTENKTDPTIPLKDMRQNWEKYSDMDTSSELYSAIWDSWYEDQKVDKTDPFVALLKDFIMGNEIPDILKIITKNTYSINSHSRQYDVFVHKNISNNIATRIVTKAEKKSTPSDKYRIVEKVIPIEKQDNVIILKSLQPDERYKIHILCDKIGLHHQSIVNTTTSKSKKCLHITKPNVWKWEFSKPNPYGKTPEFYEQRKAERENKYEARQERLSRKYCCGCDANGLDTELFCSPYIRGLYCEDCLEIESDGEGGVLSDHKFEPI